MLRHTSAEMEPLVHAVHRCHVEFCPTEAPLRIWSDSSFSLVAKRLLPRIEAVSPLMTVAFAMSSFAGTFAASAYSPAIKKNTATNIAAASAGRILRSGVVMSDAFKFSVPLETLGQFIAVSSTTEYFK